MTPEAQNASREVGSYRHCWMIACAASVAILMLESAGLWQRKKWIGDSKIHGPLVWAGQQLWTKRKERSAKKFSQMESAEGARSRCRPSLRRRC